MKPFDRAWDTLFDASPENNAALDRNTSGPASQGNLHHVTSSDTHHYFVHSSFNALNNWVMPLGMSHQVLKIPHEDWEQMDNAESDYDYPHDVITPNKKKPWNTKRVPRTYNTGLAVENWHPDDEDKSKPLDVLRQRMQDIIDLALVERDIDADPAAFGYDE
jgi:hypothetical protein